MSKMEHLNFEKTLEVLAFNFHGNEQEHHHCASDAKVIIDALVAELHKNKSLFSNKLGQLRKTATFFNDDCIDMPLCFEAFLIIQLPISMSASFNEAQRSVQLTKASCMHPFFFGDALNARCMNMRLARDLKCAFADIECLTGLGGAIYDIKYRQLTYNRTAFAHQILAKERGAVNRGIRFDFVLALEFDGADMPLPSYYNAPIGYKWFAYGLLPVDKQQNSADWGVILPRWQSSLTACQLRCHNMLILLHRLLYVNGCYCLALPLMIKLSFCLTTIEYGERFKRLCVADLYLTTLGHQVFHNICKLVLHCTTSDAATNVKNNLPLRKEQLRGWAIYAMLNKGMELNMISYEYILQYFQLEMSLDCLLFIHQYKDVPKKSTNTHKREQDM